MNLRDIHRVDRPREKLALRGAEALSDDELVALVLGSGCRGASSLEVAARLRREVGAPAAVSRAGLERLARVKGVGAGRAAAVLAAVELGRRSSAPDGRPVLDSPRRVADQVPQSVRASKKEHFLAFCLNARSQLVQVDVVSVGTLSASLVHPREVFAPAVSCSAAALVVAHNHPSGDCTPSPEDRDATRRLQRAGEVLGIPVLDHLVVSERGFFSFKENGLLS